MITATKLNRSYGDTIAISDVNFQITSGEIVGLLGHNGAGKTTIMKMLTGFLEPTSGEIDIDGLSMIDEPLEAQKRIGYLPENCPVWPDMSVVEYLEFNLGLRGIARKESAKLIKSAINRTSLHSKATEKISTLSRGFRQRVGVAQALLHDPDILILDEPTNGLDPTQIRQMRALIKELAQTATVIISTHVLQEVQAVCERVLVMRSGQLRLDSTLEELQQEQWLRVRAENADSHALGELASVKNVIEQGTDGAIRELRIEAEIVDAPEIAALLVSKGARLHSLTPITRDLETVFAEINEEIIND